MFWDMTKSASLKHGEPSRNSVQIGSVVGENEHAKRRTGREKDRCRRDGPIMRFY